MAELMLVNVSLHWDEDYDYSRVHPKEFYVPGTPEYDLELERYDSFGTKWTFMACRAVATVHVPQGLGHVRMQDFASGGLSGIESDLLDDSHRMHIELEELNDLKSYLELFNVDTSRFWRLSGHSDWEFLADAEEWWDEEGKLHYVRKESQ
jgi:hypothetical protein